MKVARQHVRQTLEARQVPEDAVDIVELLTSEVVTNAIVHAGSAPQIELSVSDQQIRVSVEDDSDDVPQLERADLHALEGRGMDLVDRLSAFWGSCPVAGGGKQVWFEVPFGFR